MRSALQRWWSHWRARRRLRDHPWLTPAAAEGDFVRVTGVVKPLDQLLTAPLSARSCVAFCSRVAAATATGVPIPSTITFGQRSFAATRIDLVPFALEYAQGSTLVVEATAATIELPPVSLAPDTKSRKDQFLLHEGTSLRASINARFEEIVVEPGSRISVLGIVMLDPTTTPPTTELGFRDPPPPSIRLTGNAQHPLVIVHAT
ncbi:MAG: hypothetical protein AB7O24_32825 [Kofleriaceae bacterium]